MAYDSSIDTKNHIEIVKRLLASVIKNLEARAVIHDASKLVSPEKEMYDEFTPKLKELTYGSEEYKVTLKEMGTALKHHYENNTHHPEHFIYRIDGMNLLDLIEMFCDWYAAGLRHANGDMIHSLEINKTRFKMNDQLFEIFKNTYREIKLE